MNDITNKTILDKCKELLKKIEILNERINCMNMIEGHVLGKIMFLEKSLKIHADLILALQERNCILIEEIDFMKRLKSEK